MSTLATVVLENLPILQVVLPLIAAPICILLRRGSYAWGLATAVSWISFGISLQLLRTVLVSGTWSYEVGGWPPPWGIEIRIEPMNAFVLIIVSAISSLVLMAAPHSFAKELPKSRHYLAYAAFLLCQTGLLGMTTAGDAFNVFVFLEISSLSSYALIAMGPHRRALISAFRYLIIGTTGGTFLLLGIGMLYMATGTLNILDLSQRLQGLGSNRTVLVGLVCVVVGTTIKLALLPLGAWLPNAYTYAPSVVTAFLAATSTKVSYYVLLRFLFRIFGADMVFGKYHLEAVLLPLALLSMFVGAGLAAVENDVKRLLAFSSLSQVGYMVLGLAMVSVTGLTGGIVHLFNHAVMKSGLFLVIAAVTLRLGSTHLDDWRGLGHRMPRTMAAFVIGGLSMIGVPLTVGFVSKWYLVLGALEQGRWWIAMLVLLSSLLALIYIWKVIEVIYLHRPAKDAPELEEAPWSLLVPIWLLAAACLYFGIFTEHSAGVARIAAEALFSGAL